MPKTDVNPTSYDTRSEFPPAESAAHLKLDNPRPKNVLKAFDDLPQTGTHLRASCAGEIIHYRYTDYTFYNHFQGMQRVGTSRYLIVSGGDQGVQAGEFSNRSASHLFLVEMGSRGAVGPWKSNLKVRSLEAKDRIKETFVLDNEMWHAGGISLMGQVLAVPIYGSYPNSSLSHSSIVFLDMSFPEIPKLFPFAISRPDAKAGAVALTRLANGCFICGVWSDSDDQPHLRPRFDFYISVDTDFANGFRDDVVATWEATEVRTVPGVDGGFTKYQALNFVTQHGRQSGPHRLYLIGTEKKDGNDTADLFQVEFPAETEAPQPQLRKPQISKVRTKAFKCTDVHGQFDAANGVHIDHDGRMYLYSAYYWRIDNMIRFAEFA